MGIKPGAVGWLACLGLVVSGCLQVEPGGAAKANFVSGGLDADSGSDVPDAGSADADSGPGAATCVIDGISYASRSLNPANVGQCCNPATSPSAWLPLLSPGASVTAIGGPNDGVIADFNGDGFPDVAVTTSSPNNVYVYLGLADGGGYADPFTYEADTWPIDVTAGDMNGDGLADLIVGTGDSVVVLLSNGDGTFGVPQVTPANCRVGPLRTADIDGDGWTDVVAASPGCGLSIFLNLASGNGAVANATNLSISDPNQVEIADVNGDGSPDIVAADSELVVALNDGHGGFPTITTTDLSNAQGFAEPPGFAVASFSGGHQQVAATTQTALLLMGIDGTTGAGTQLSSATLDTWGQRACAVDLNGDGLPDVVSFGDPGVGISINSAGGTFAGSFDIPLSGIQMITAGDLNGDGAPDVLVMYGASEGDNGPFVQYLNSCP